MDKFSFDEWMQLYKSNPAEYEKRRTDILKAAIEDAPIKHRNSMRMTQVECDAIHRMYPPLVATAKIAELMAAKLQDLSAHLTKLRELIEDSNDSSYP